MPRPGFSSISITDEIYKKYYDKYQAEHEEHRAKGINSFAAYIAHLINLGANCQDQQETTTTTTRDIRELLVVQNTILLGMFGSMQGLTRAESEDALVTCRLAMSEYMQRHRPG